jgi:hypothetical protein
MEQRRFPWPWSIEARPFSSAATFALQYGQSTMNVLTDTGLGSVVKDSSLGHAKVQVCVFGSDG